MLIRLFSFAAPFLLMLGLISPAFAQEQSLLPETALTAGESRLVEMDAASGDYIVGTVVSADGRFTLDLVDGEGGHIRRFAAGRTGSETFRFVAGGKARLKLSAVTAGRFALTIDQRVHAADPVAETPTAPVYDSPAIAALADRIAKGASTEAFWQQVAQAGTPLVEDGADGMKIMTFVARGARHNVRIFGAPTGEHEEMEQLGTSDVWFKSFTVPAGSRLSYQLAVDVPWVPGSARDRRVAILATAKADPLNRHPTPEDAPDAYNQDSVVELEQSPPQPWVALRDGVAKGRLDHFMFASGLLGNERRISLYTPPGFDPSRRDTILLFAFDGDEYQTRVPLPRILDNMIADGAVPPVVAVLVANPDREARARELPGNSLFADFMARELLPEVLRRTGIAHDPARTVLAGSSYGGLAAMTVALAHPESFGNVLGMSGSFWWSPAGTPADRNEYVAAEIAKGEKPALRVFLSAGLFETGHSGGTSSILDTNRHLRDVLQAKGVPLAYREYAGGHDYIIWRGTISDGLTALFPRR